MASAAEQRVDTQPMSLKRRAIRRAAGAIPVLALLLFVPAGTIRYWQGWVFLAFVTVPTILGTVWLYRTDPKLLERRLQGKEERKQQKVWQIVWTLIFFPSLLLAAADHRFGWTLARTGDVPLWFTVLSQGLVLAGTLTAFWVMNVNRYASRTIEVQPDQTVITTGPYAVVRHPMYSGIMLQMLFTPVALGSFVTWPLFALLNLTLVFRLWDEERFLKINLPGYTEYCRRTKWRLVPHVW